MNAAQRAREQLQTWPQLSWGSASCGAGEALRFHDVEIMHFHSPCDAALHLTEGAIDRLRAELVRSTAIRIYPASEWITVQLDCQSDVDLLLALVSVALHVHTPHGADSRPAPVTRPCSIAIGQLGSIRASSDKLDDHLLALTE